MNFHDFKHSFDIQFHEYILLRLQKLSNLSTSTDLTTFTKILEKHLEGGKRLRPYVAQLAYESEGGADMHNELLFSIELLHAFALIHDDIIDNSTVRHNKPTLHVSIENLYTEQHALGQASHLGLSQAILLGDIVFSWSGELFESSIEALPFDQQKKMRALYQSLIQEVMLGEMLDIHLTSMSEVSTAAITEKTKLKTALYSFARPMMLGANFANTDKEKLAWYEMLGTHIGMAFQISDDIIDLRSTEATSGKQQGKDITERQHTLLSQHVFSHGTAEMQETLRNFFGKTLTMSECEQVVAIMEQSGAFEAAQTMLRDELAQAKKLVIERSDEQFNQQTWLALIETIEHRTA
jgi:geranylgeranyl diphosphate synthase type I